MIVPFVIAGLAVVRAAYFFIDHGLPSKSPHGSSASRGSSGICIVLNVSTHSAGSVIQAQVWRHGWTRILRRPRPAIGRGGTQQRQQQQPQQQL